MKENNQLKEQILAIMEDIREEGYDLQDDVFVLQWRYDEEPDVNISLYIGYNEQEESPLPH